MTEVARHMCTRVLLDDGITERNTHFRVVDANDYDELAAELHKLKFPPCKHPMQSGSVSSDGTGHSQCMHCGLMLFDTRPKPPSEVAKP